MIEIIPAVLPKSFDDLHEHLERIHTAGGTVQVDVVDGIFAHGKTWPYKDGGTFDTIVAQEQGLPFWDELDFQFDLMVQAPAATVMNYVHAGASQIVLHVESLGVVDALHTLSELREEGGAFSVTAGLAVAPTIAIETLEPFEALFDFIQVMGIEHVGKQGEPLDKHAVFLVERLRKRYPAVPIQVDGGVKKEHVKALVAAGATRLIVGSAIFGSDDALGALQEFRDEVRV